MLAGTKLYGAAPLGGALGDGTVFSLNTDGTGLSLLHPFGGVGDGSGEGETPNGSLAISGSRLFGTTQLGGAFGGGTLFAVNTDGTGFSLLRSFPRQFRE